ncbi:Chemotaxis protein CheW [Gammaproteobacteria bacterium]
MKSEQSMVVFSIDARRYAVALHFVQRVVRVTAVTSVPKAPSFLLGIFNLRGTVLPVINMRERLDHVQRPIQLSDQLLIIAGTKQTMAFLVDNTYGVIECVPADPGPLLSDLFSGMVKWEGGLILTLHPDHLLSRTEEVDIFPVLKNGDSYRSIR